MAKVQTNKFEAMLEAVEKNIMVLNKIDIEKNQEEARKVLENPNYDRKYSNEVTNYMRKMLVSKAFIQSHDLTNGTLYLTRKAFKQVVNALDFHSSVNGGFASLLLNWECKLDSTFNGYKVTYCLNESSITNGYIHFLNVELGLDIPERTGEEKLKEIDNSVLTANYNPTDLAAMEA